MSKKERDRKALMEMVRQKKLSLKQASVQCKLSYRQTLRIYQNHEQLGDAGLIHKSRGRQSKRHRKRSPQAKGRVERSHAVYQDRLVKDLALKGVKTITSANAVLNKGFIANLNRKFEKPAQEKEAALKTSKIKRPSSAWVQTNTFLF